MTKIKSQPQLIARLCGSSQSIRHSCAPNSRHFGSCLLSGNHRSSRLPQNLQAHRNFPGTFVAMPIRWFETVSDYHRTADETLEDIQDAVEEALEDKGIPEFEVNYASGVLTMTFPPHGTWVINKQTPNQQLWWSSPISGPRRYEFENGEWVYTRDDSQSMTLLQDFQEEIKEIYDVDLDL